MSADTPPTTTAHVAEYAREEMREACRNNFNTAINKAAGVCADAAIRLSSNGRSRVNQVDRHTAEVLRDMEQKILGLKETPNA